MLWSLHNTGQFKITQFILLFSFNKAYFKWFIFNLLVNLISWSYHQFLFDRVNWTTLFILLHAVFLDFFFCYWILIHIVNELPYSLDLLVSVFLLHLYHVYADTQYWEGQYNAVEIECENFLDTRLISMLFLFRIIFIEKCLAGFLCEISGSVNLTLVSEDKVNTENRLLTINRHEDYSCCRECQKIFSP